MTLWSLYWPKHSASRDTTSAFLQGDPRPEKPVKSMDYLIQKSAPGYPGRLINRQSPGKLVLNCRLVERTGRLLNHE